MYKSERFNWKRAHLKKLLDLVSIAKGKRYYCIASLFLVVSFFPSIAGATNFLYQASGTAGYQVDGNSGTSEIWGSAIISNKVHGDHTNIPFNHELAEGAMYWFWYTGDNFVFNFDFGTIAGNNITFMGEAGYYMGVSDLLGFANGWFRGDEGSVQILDWEFRYSDGSPYDDTIYDGQLLAETPYGDLPPIIYLYFDGYYNASTDLCGEIYLSKVAPVPEPATLILFGLGGTIICVHRRRKGHPQAKSTRHIVSTDWRDKFIG